MARIIFVWPPVTAEERYGAIAEGGTFMPPLGIASLAAVCRKAGHEVRVLDCEALGLSPSQSAERMLDWHPDYVGFSSTTLGIFAAAKVAKILRENQNNLKIIIGGPHVTSVPEKTMELFPYFDIGVLREGERTIIELLDSIENNGKLDRVDGLALRKGGTIHLTENRQFIKALDELPIPAYDLFPRLTETYRTPVFSLYREPAMSVILSRGCPGRCCFCDRSVFGKVTRAHSADYALRLWKMLHFQYGIKDIMVQDDTFTAFRKLLVQTCEKLKTEQLDMRWTCNARVDYMTPQILKLMKEAGCWAIAYGIETGSQRILDYMGKRITLAQVRKAVRWTREAGIRSRGFFILGYPTETKAEIGKTIEFMLNLDLDDIHVSLFTPFPNTESYYQALENGTLDDDWSKMSQWNPVFKPAGFEDGDLERYLRQAVRGFYLRPRIILSYLFLIKDRQNARKLFLGAKAFTKLMLKH